MNAAASAQKSTIQVYKIVVLGDGGVGKSGMCTILDSNSDHEIDILFITSGHFKNIHLYNLMH